MRSSATPRDRNLRILHVYKTYYTESLGGIEQFIRQLGRHHARMGHAVSVLTLSDKPGPEVLWHEGIRVLRYPLNFEIASNGFSLKAMAGFRALAGEFDLLHYHFPWPSGDLLHQLAPGNIPALVTYHSDIVRQKLLKRIYEPLMNRFIGQMKAIVSNSPNYLATSPVLQAHPDRTSIIPIGIDRTTYPVPDAMTLAKWREMVGDNFFLFVGVLRYYKGLQTLIEAAARTGFPVVIAGQGPQEAEWRDLAETLGAKVHWVGRVEDVDKVALLTLCRAFVFPSCQRSEAFGISLLEAAMFGKPMISCEIGTGTSFINQDEVTGFVVPPEDTQAFAAAMTKLANDDALTARLGQAAEARYASIFTAEAMAESYDRLYRELTAPDLNEIPTELLAAAV